ncbi:hypothetical protein HYV86_03020 [Candidatus Woesearchaeota archaeon]|nr:hypothetical protein [Candidatus Woesearchaeota archaeon]
MKRGVFAALLVFAFCVPLFFAALTTPGRYDDFTTNTTIVEYNNVSWRAGNVSFTGSGDNYVLNISQNNSQVVTLSEATTIKGIANNGTYVFANDNGAAIKIAYFNGTVVSNHAITGLGSDGNNMAASGQFLYSRNGNSVLMVNLTANTTTTVNINSTYPLLSSADWLNNNLHDMPDGRIGTVGNVNNDTFKVRLFNVSANGTSFNWSEDITISASPWNTDNHGFASDGTYLTLISFTHGHKVYNLVNRSEHHANTVWTIRPTGIGNPTFITHDHINKRILVGDYADRDFIIFNDTRTSTTSLNAGNFTSTTTTVVDNIYNITNVSWTTAGESSGNTISLQISVDNGTTWNTATNNQKMDQQFANNNRSLLYRALYSTISNTTLYLTSVTLNWTQGTIDDTTAPTVTIMSPINTTYTSLPLLFNVSSNENSTAWYALNNGANRSMDPNSSNTGFNSSNGTLADGNYNFTVYINDTSGNINLSSIVFSLNTTDIDGDGVSDLNDTLLYNESNVTTSGLTLLNITIAGNRTNTNFTGWQDVKFYDNTTALLNFSYNFSAGSLDLSKIRITKTSTSLIVNMSDQLRGATKTLYMSDDNFVTLCVKDALISSVGEIGDGCTGTNETLFTSCLGNATGVTLNGISCTDAGAVLTISNLTHSGIRATQAAADSPSSGSSGGGGGGGGSSTAPIPEIEEEPEIRDGPFSVGVKLIQLTLRQGEQRSRFVRVSNPWDVEKEIKLSIDDSDFLELGDDEIDLAAHNSVSVEVVIKAPQDMASGTYVKSLVLEDDQTKKEVLISITVIPRASLFDIVLDVDSDSVLEPNGTIVLNVDLLKLIVAAAEDVRIYYRLGYPNGTVLQEYSDTRAVETDLEYQKELLIPPWMEPGDYVLTGEVSYHNETATASVPVRISSPPVVSYTGLSIMLLLSVGVFSWYVKDRTTRKREQKKGQKTSSTKSSTKRNY